MWTRATGVQPIIGGGGLIAYHFGTDGADMVWTEKDSSGAFIATAKFISAPDTVVGKRIASAESTHSSHPFVVGCGFAARVGSVGDVSGVRVVRLSDGASWLVPNRVPDLLWTDPLGVTCDEVFLSASVTGVAIPGVPATSPRLARVRLDSLGPPLP